MADVDHHDWSPQLREHYRFDRSTFRFFRVLAPGTPGEQAEWVPVPDWIGEEFAHLLTLSEAR